MIYHKVDFFRVPDFLNAHLTEHFDCQGSGAVLGHGHVGRQNGDFSSVMDLTATVGLDADDLLSESKRVVVEDCLGQ